MSKFIITVSTSSKRFFLYRYESMAYETPVGPVAPCEPVEPCEPFQDTGENFRNFTKYFKEDSNSAFQFDYFPEDMFIMLKTLLPVYCFVEVWTIEELKTYEVLQ